MLINKETGEIYDDLIVGYFFTCFALVICYDTIYGYFPINSLDKYDIIIDGDNKDVSEWESYNYYESQFYNTDLGVPYD